MDKKKKYLAFTAHAGPALNSFECQTLNISTTILIWLLKHD